MGNSKSLNVLAGNLGYIAVGSAIFLTWAASFWLVSHSLHLSSGGQRPPLSDLATLLFGATSIALFIFSMLIAFLAIFGWRNLQEDIREKVRLEASERIKDLERSRISPLENEAKGRVLTALGYLMGEMSINPKSLEVIDRERLSEAVRLCREAYEVLRQMEGPAEYMSLNNLVFYSSLSGDIHKTVLLKQARDLKNVGQERRSTILLLTACRAILLYGEDNGERQDIFEILSLMKLREGISERERKEAERLLGLFHTQV
jgi:hypothetical protein